jgi:hypothetical protein
MHGKRYRNQYESRVKFDPLTGKETREYRYNGEYYHCLVEKGIAQAAYKWIMCCAALFWIGFISGGFVNAPGTRSIWVLPVFLFSVFPGFYAALAAWKLCRLPEIITEPQKKESIDSVKISAWAIVILSALASAGGMVVLLSGAAFEQQAEEITFLGCSILRLLSGWGLLHFIRNLKYEEIQPQSIAQSPEK